MLPARDSGEVADPLTRGLEQTARLIWREVLSLPLGRMASVGVPMTGPGTLEGRVGIEGAWTGEVALRCPVRLARHVAGVMFAVPAHEARVDQIQDALAELANMVAGNIKALLPEPCALGLPRLRAGCDAAAHQLPGPIAAGGRFECEGETVQILLAEYAPPKDGRAAESGGR